MYLCVFLVLIFDVFVCVFVFLSDIRMSKAAEEEKPGADYPGDSSGTHTHTHTHILHSVFHDMNCTTKSCIYVFLSWLYI